MYNLYVWVNSWKEIDSKNDEIKIANKMEEYYKKFELVDFMIIERKLDRDEIYLRTRNEGQVINYLDKFKENNCKVLKKEL